MWNPVNIHVVLATPDNKSDYIIDNYARHIHISSDENIEADDLCIDINSHQVFTCGKNESNCVYDKSDGWLRLEKNCRKIIATTDKTKKVLVEDVSGSDGCPVFEQLPTPSDEWIKSFIDQYDRGNIVKKQALIKYKDGKLKVDRKNCITILPVKDRWSREEIVDSIEEAMINDISLGEFRDMWILK